MHALWRAGDADALWERMARDMQRKYPGLYRRINVERNDAWLPEVEARLGRLTDFGICTPPKRHCDSDNVIATTSGRSIAGLRMSPRSPPVNVTTRTCAPVAGRRFPPMRAQNSP